MGIPFPALKILFKAPLVNTGLPLVATACLWLGLRIEIWRCNTEGFLFYGRTFDTSLLLLFIRNSTKDREPQVYLCASPGVER